MGPREHLGGQWEQQDGHEGVRNKISIDLTRFLDPSFKVFWALRLDISISFLSCLHVTFLPIFESNFGCLGLLKPGFRAEGIAKTAFHRNRLFRLSAFSRLWEQFF